jgi:acyl-CoA thioester hydrolase
MYGHVNNVIYYSWADTAINSYLIAEAGLKPSAGATNGSGGSDAIGLCVRSACVYFDSLSFPEPVSVGLRVSALGVSSVTYSFGIFPAQSASAPTASAASKQQPQQVKVQGRACAAGEFVHVFVDRTSRKPTPIPAPIRSALQRLQSPATAAAKS